MSSLEDAVKVTFYEPPEDLERFFTTFYCVDIEAGEGGEICDALQPEWAGLRIFSGARPKNVIGDRKLSGADCVVTGPSSLPLEFTIGSTRLWGIGILPLGWATFVGEPADRFANTVVDARKTGLFAHFADLADALLMPDLNEQQQLGKIESFFLRDAPRFGKEDPRINAIHEVLVGVQLPHVAEMAELCGLNQRTMERLCRRHFGFSPKVLLRRQRFMRSLTQFVLDPSMGWIGALDSLYFDQSHFVRDCREFLGMTPSEYAAADHPVILGFMKERMRAHGSAVQTLDAPEPG